MPCPLFFCQYFIELVHKAVDILKLPVNRGKPNIADLIQRLQPLHYQLTDIVALYLTFQRVLNDLLDLKDIMRKPVRQLSLGERMKCELAAALLHRPKVLFLDEPTIGLDVGAQVRIRAFLKEYNRRSGATMMGPVNAPLVPGVQATGIACSGSSMSIEHSGKSSPAASCTPYRSRP